MKAVLLEGIHPSAVEALRVALPEHAGKSRLPHIHRNMPGVLAHLNERLASAGINIAAQ